MNITMTGDSGFIGNAVAREVLTQDFRFTSIGRRPSHMPTLKEITATDPRLISQLDVPTVDVFLHLAALPVTTGKQTRAEVFDTNAEWPLDCLKMDVEVAKFQLYTIRYYCVLNLIAACSNTASCKVTQDA